MRQKCRGLTEDLGVRRANDAKGVDDDKAELVLAFTVLHEIPSGPLGERLGSSRGYG